MITIESCDGYFTLVDDTHGHVGIAQTKSRAQACRIRDALNADNTILGRRVRQRDGDVEGVVVAIGTATCTTCADTSCIAFVLRDDDGDFCEATAHTCRVVAPPDEAGAPIEASRGHWIDASEARSIIAATEIVSAKLPAALRARLEKIATEPTP